jgi:hypothetical protein
MKNAFVTEVGCRVRDRLGYFPQIWPARYLKRRDDEIEKCDKRTSHPAEGGPPGRQHSQIQPDCMTPDPKVSFRQEILRK